MQQSESDHAAPHINSHDRMGHHDESSTHTPGTLQTALGVFERLAAGADLCLLHFLLSGPCTTARMLCCWLLCPERMLLRA